jgi:hypothetical protein
VFDQSGCSRFVVQVEYGCIISADVFFTAVCLSRTITHCHAYVLFSTAIISCVGCRICCVAAQDLKQHNLITIYHGPFLDPAPTSFNCVVDIDYQPDSGLGGVFKQAVPVDHKSEAPFLASSTNEV